MCRVNMQGYLMEIDYGMHVRQRLEVRFDGIDCSYLDYRIEVLFGDPEVADYLLNEVRIGEDVVLVDEDSGITFAIAVYTDSIYIKTVYNAYDPVSYTHLFQEREYTSRKAIIPPINANRGVKK